MTPPCETIVTRREPARARRRSQGSSTAWLVSLLFHAAAICALGATIIRMPQGSAGGGRGGHGISLEGQFGGQTPSYLHVPATSRFELPNAAPALIEIATPARPFAPQPRQQPYSQIALASATSSLPPEPQTATAIHGSAQPLSPASPSRGQPSQGTATGGGGDTQLFGVPGRGSRIVYVFDRSASMDGSRLAAAKRELIVSLQALGSRQQFQIIFYSQQPEAMPLVSRGSSAPMIFADERGKRQAEQFVRSRFADGPTHHRPALVMALDMRPDVIYFLTDADEPQLSHDELQDIRQRNHGTVINTIEFGSGPPVASYNFLRQLASENAGQHAYVDVNRFIR